MARTKPRENATDGDADRARELSDAIADLKEGMVKLLGGLDTLHYNLREVELMARIVTGDRKREGGAPGSDLHPGVPRGAAGVSGTEGRL